LETTLFNFYVDEDRDAHTDTVKLFKEISQGKYEAYTSTYVTEELENAPEAKRDKMMKPYPAKIPYRWLAYCDCHC
jgi:predicted nucleic acid-binding protein